MNIDQLFKFEDELEKPLDNLLSDGGFSAIFRTIGCIGDSLSSGELESLDEFGVRKFHDYYEHSWGQYIARVTGAKVYNFSRGGMKAHIYCNSFAAENGFWDKDKACEAYVIALGVNDEYKYGKELGNVDTDVDFNDWRNNQPTFIGFYAQIIQRLLEIQPKARFFLMTIPRSSGIPAERAEAYDIHARLLHELAKHFEYTYVLDFRRYAPEYDDNFKKRFYLGGHMNTMGYLLTAKMVMSYIDFIIRHDTEDFCQAGFIGRGGLHNIDYKW